MDTAFDDGKKEGHEEGFIEGAVNIDYRASNFKSKIMNLDKSKKILIYCGSGRRSQGAMEVAEELGFTQVYDMKGGIKSWTSEGRKIIQ